MKEFGTEQEAFWAGEFGDTYIERNRGPETVASNTALFSRVLKRTQRVRSVIEFGANVGLNLQSIRALLPTAEFAAVEINQRAVTALQAISGLRVHHQSLFEYSESAQYDLALVKGVLIHISPEKLTNVYELLHRSSSRYICMVELYNPTPVSVSYRGHENRLFKRDFAGEMLDRYSGLRLLDYGFVYRRDPCFPQDDVTWFLLEKSDDNRNSRQR